MRRFMKINWNRRLLDSPCHIGPYTLYTSVDGTDCPINEQQPFNPKWYSHKFHGPGLRYEIGLSVETATIVWVNGPFECGSYPDNKIFKLDMKGALQNDEYVIADGGYTDYKCIRNVMASSVSTKIHQQIRARHETVNERLKNFNVLRHIFRHDLSKHGLCFHAVSQIVAIAIDTTSPLFKINL